MQLSELCQNSNRENQGQSRTQEIEAVLWTISFENLYTNIQVIASQFLLNWDSCLSLQHSLTLMISVSLCKYPFQLGGTGSRFSSIFTDDLTQSNILGYSYFLLSISSWNSDKSFEFCLCYGRACVDCHTIIAFAWTTSYCKHLLCLLQQGLLQGRKDGSLDIFLAMVWAWERQLGQ